MTTSRQNEKDPTVTHYITVKAHRPMTPYSHQDQETFSFTVTTQRGDELLPLFCKTEKGFETALHAMIAVDSLLKFWEPSF